MKAAYIGILTPGTTSRMRAERLRSLRPDWHWDWVDTDVAMHGSARFWRSLAFRCKSGLAVDRINAVVLSALTSGDYGLVWVDKGVFLTRATMGRLRNVAQKIVHFTPDTAFYANRSRHFEGGLDFYDLLVTTKSFEVAAYEAAGVEKRLLVTTQGYDPVLHRPLETASARKREVAFVGLAEPDRLRCVEALLEAGIAVRLGGMGWEPLVRRYRQQSNLRYEGSRVFGEAYARIYAEAWVGLGLLSKRFPERHTTRTFEIPACGAVLATERTTDTSRYFMDDEVVFFDDHRHLAERVAFAFGHLTDEDLASLAGRGRERLSRDGRDYPSLLEAILRDERLGLPNRKDAG